ncbi:hypothetical protein [Calothrix sp. 336/3]|uniref:hypothetical protein n=1 Tax=Calothrix sp. 336/3 TaxID=1337936 RepID=UPI000A6A26BD|nr:hypothetical protein [Calothrix sp. 336/3]
MGDRPSPRRSNGTSLRVYDVANIWKIAIISPVCGFFAQKQERMKSGWIWVHRRI